MANVTPLRTCTNEAEFNVFLMKISDEITIEEVAKMKFLCSHLRRPLEAIEERVEFVNFLRRHAESLNSFGFRRLCDVAHRRDDSESTGAILKLFKEAHDVRKTLPEKDQKCPTHAHNSSKLGLCHVLQVMFSLVFFCEEWGEGGGRGEALF